MATPADVIKKYGSMEDFKAQTAVPTTPVQTQAPATPVEQTTTQPPVQATLPQQTTVEPSVSSVSNPNEEWTLAYNIWEKNNTAKTTPATPVATQAPVDNSVVFGQQASDKQAIDTTYLDKRNEKIAQQTIDQLNSIANQGQKVDATTRDSVMEWLIAKAGWQVQWDNRDRQNTIDQINTKVLQQTGSKDWNTAFSTINKPYSQITQYTNGESLWKALDSGLVSASQLENIKKFNPQVYNEYQAQKEKETNLALVNMSKPTTSALVADKGMDVSQLFQSLGLDMTKSADIDLVAKRQELYSTGEVKTAQDTYLKDKKGLETLQDTYMNIEDDVRKEYEGTGVTESFIMAKVANRQKPIYKQMQTQQRNYSNSLEAMQLAMWNAKDELDIYSQQATLDRQETMDKLQVGQFAYSIMADQQAREDKFKLADIQFQQEKDMLAYKYDMEYGDINSSDPRIKERAIANNVDLLMKQYDGLIMISRDQLVESVKTGMSAGKTYWTMLGEIMDDIRSEPNYREYMNNKAGIDTQPRSLWGDMYTVYENGKWVVKTGEDLNPSPTAIQQMKEATVAERQLYGESQYDNQEFVNQILNGELKTRAGVACLPWQIGGQCGAFVNDLLGTSFGNTIESKINYAKTAGQYSPIPVVWWWLVIDNGSTYTDANGNKVNAGHVAIITAVNANGTINYIDSNGLAGKETIGINKNRAVTDKMYFTRAKGRQAPTTAGATGSKGGAFDANLNRLYEKWTPTQADLSAAWLTAQEYWNQKTNYFDWKKSQWGDIPLDDKMQSRVDGIAKSFQNEQSIKEFQTVQDWYNTILKIDNNTANPWDDMQLIYALAKTYDPNSVVREWEYATAQKYLTSWADEYKFKIKRVWKASTFLSPEAREGIKATIGRVYDTKKQSYTNIYDQYVGRINNIIGREWWNQYLQDYAIIWFDTNNKTTSWWTPSKPQSSSRSSAFYGSATTSPLQSVNNSITGYLNAMWY